jgi:diketogulonate reductase-like aldo/keto reductase
MTIGQAALKWLLASPAVMTTLPNIYNVEQLEEFAAASELPDLTADDLQRIDELQRINFGVHEEHMRYKGTMVRDGEPLGPHYRYAGDGFPGAPDTLETAAAD